MATSSQPFSRLSGGISDYFLIETRMANTRAVQVFKALDKFRKQSIGLVVTRQPILSDGLDLFAPLVAQLGKVSDVRSFGVDANGLGFLVVPILDGYRIWEASPDAVELERRYLAALRLIGKLHQMRVFCADLCLESFIFDRSGIAQLLGGLGSLPFVGPQQLEPSEGWSSCVAPEQFKGDTASCATDVFALGVIGYKLFAGQYPQFDDTWAIAAKASSLSASAPGWLDGVLEVALRPSPDDRPQDVHQLLQLITEAREGLAARDVLPSPSSPTPEASVPALTTSRAIAVATVSTSDKAPTKPSPSTWFTAKQLRLIRVSVLSFLLVAGLGMGLRGEKLFSGSPKQSPAIHSATDMPSGLPTLQPGGDLASYLNQLVASDDPLAHDLLVRALRDSGSPERSMEVWESILLRIRRAGFVRTADYLRTWGRVHGVSPQRFGFLEPFLRLADPSLPTSVRLERLEIARSVDKNLSLALAAAIGLDVQNINEFHHVFVESAAEALRIEVAAVNGRSTGSLILATPEVATFFIDDIVNKPELVPDQDLLWLLPEMIKQKWSGAKKVSEQVVSRGILPPLRKIFLDILNQKPDLPHNVQTSLVACAISDGQSIDVRNFAAWYDTEAEVALWALILSVQSSEVRAMAFDALATKPLLSAPITEIYEAVRAKLFASREACSIPLAGLALESVIPDAVFEASLQGLDQIPNARTLIGILLSSSSTRAVLKVLNLYGGLAESSELLKLLKHGDPRIRSEAVAALSSTNDAGIITILSESYKDERDPSVRAVYEQRVGVIKERVEG